MLASIVVLLVAATGADAVSGSWTDTAAQFALGPVAPSIDLRNMLTVRLVRRACAELDTLARRRREAFASGTWETWRDNLRGTVLEGMAPMPFGAQEGDLNVRAVSRHEREHYIVENVLFESFQGLDVNASVYLPRPEQFPPPWPAIVVPVGHSSKVGSAYQIPAQVFARCGYIAATFDPPGMAGEKPDGNDHFRDGVRCYLTGQSANRFFVIDALRCADYLAARPDVDAHNGIGITGVSGGGVTAMHAALLDHRLVVCGPACCAVSKALHPVLDNYAECPEVMQQGRLCAYDDPDLLAALCPKAVLLMAGATDEVFTEPMSRDIAAEAQAMFAQAGQADRFAFFLDPGGHDYTVAMALQFAQWMDRWVRGTPGRPLPEVAPDSVEVLPADMLACRPRTDRNIFTVTRDEAAAVRERRGPAASAEDVARVIGVAGPVDAPPSRGAAPVQSWFHYVQEVMLEPEPGIELPATFLYPVRADWKGGAVLYFDDRGRWTDLRTQGMLTRVTGFIQRDTDGPAVFTVDLRGWGDSRPADMPYDLAGWGSRGQWTVYIAAGLGDGLLAQRVRDGLAALAWLRRQPCIDGARIVVGGRGLGGVVALHVAAVDPHVAGVFSIDGLAAFEMLAESKEYDWTPDAFLPGVLRAYDLPELVAGLPMPVFLARPLDAMHKPLDDGAAQTLYAPALPRGGVRVMTALDEGELLAFIRAATHKS